MNKKAYLILALLIPTFLFAQKATISGFIYDNSSGERMISANVYEKSSYKGTSTNNFGFYSLTLPCGEVELSYSFIGFKTKSIRVNLQKDTIITLGLDLQEAIEEIKVYGESADKIRNTEMSVISLPISQIEKIPVILGETDLLKVLQLLPGVQGGTEGTSGIYVRGGGPDQNLFLLDGVPVYNVDHLFGFFSVFNPASIKTVKLYKGGFPARFGGRLSSVIDISMKDGNMKKIQGEASIGLISSRFAIEGPIFKDKTSFILSGRRTYVDLLMKPFVALSNKLSDRENSAGYYFYDFNAKFNHIFSPNSRLYLSGYFGLDEAFMKDQGYYVSEHIRYDTQNQSSINWGNGTGAIRWNYVFNNRLFSNFTATYSNYNFNITESMIVENTKVLTKQEDRFKYFSGIEDIALKADFDFYPLPGHEIKFGTNYTNHTFKPGVNHYKNTNDADTSQNLQLTFGNKNIYADELFIYLEDDFELGPLFKCNLGLHANGFDVQNQFYASLQPRASVRFKASENVSVKASYAKMTQNIHLLSSSTISLPTDLWLPTTQRVKPQNSHQFAIGTFFKLPANFDLSLEGYYKHMDHLLEYRDGASFASASAGWEDQIEIGRGWSYGAELLLERKVGKTTGWIGYTLAWTNRQFENINFGNPFPARYDRRHDISIALTHEFSKRADIGVTWVYGTGNAVTLGLQQYKNYTSASSQNINYHPWSSITYYESRNNYRMPAYHRLDIGLNLHRKVRWGMQTWNFSAYNTYSRQNPFYLYWGYKNTNGYDPETGWYFEDSVPALKQISLFPIIPSVSYTLKF